MKSSFKAHVGLLFANLFFAINLTAVKHLTENGYMQPFAMNVIRAGFSAILFWLLFLLQPPPAKIIQKDIPLFFLCALTGIAINQMFFLKGLSLTFSIHAVLLMLTTPILITIIAAWVLQEKLTFYKMMGLFLGIAGATLLLASGKNSGGGSNIMLGDIFILINALSYTIYFILVKPLMLQYNAVQVIRWIFTIGFVLILPFGCKEFFEINWSVFGFVEYTCLVLIVLGGTFLAYLFTAYGIKEVGASVAGAYIYVQPIFAAAIAHIFLKEKLEMYKLVAAVLIFCGVYFANKKIAEKR
jgi:drug/metabolite transporter (DMT)-like permease